MLAADEGMVEVEIQAPQGKKDDGYGPVCATQFEKLALLRLDDGEDEEQRCSSLIDNEMHQLYCAEYQSRRGYIEERAAAPQTEPDAIERQARKEVDDTLSDAREVLRDKQSYQVGQEKEEQQASEHYFLCFFHPDEGSLA